MSTRNSSATGRGSSFGVLKNASGKASSAPRPVPASAMPTVSSNSQPSPSLPVPKKKLQSGCSRPVPIAASTLRLVCARSGASMPAVQTTTHTSTAAQSARFAPRGMLRSPRMMRPSAWLSHSMQQTVTNRHTRIAPTRPYSRHEIFSLSSRPMPPAPT